MATVSVGHQRQVMLLSTVCVLAGLYLAVSPILSHYKYSSGMTTVNVALGMLIAAMAYFRATIGGGTPWVSWVLIGLGVITLGAPFWMRYAFVDAFRMQHLIVGGIVVGLELINAILTHLVLAKQKS
jgi:hypothetical protein